VLFPQVRRGAALRDYFRSVSAHDASCHLVRDIGVTLELVRGAPRRPCPRLVGPLARWSAPTLRGVAGRGGHTVGMHVNDAQLQRSAVALVGEWGCLCVVETTRGGGPIRVVPMSEQPSR
jgi:hypothetical protein